MNDKKTIEEFAKKMDFEGLANVFHQGNIQWHSEEWEKFIETIRNIQKGEFIKLVEGNKKVRPSKSFADKLVGLEYKLWKSGYNQALKDVLKEIDKL